MDSCLVPVLEHSRWLLNHHVKLNHGPATCEAKYILALILAGGHHVNIDLRSDSTGSIRLASRRGLQRLRHLHDFYGCKQRLPPSVFETAKYQVLRTWLTLTPNLQTEVRSTSSVV